MSSTFKGGKVAEIGLGLDGEAARELAASLFGSRKRLSLTRVNELGQEDVYSGSLVSVRSSRGNRVALLGA